MAANRHRRVDVYLIGRGIRDGVEQMTTESLNALKASRLVFETSGDAESVRGIHPNVIDMADDYWTGELCDDVYARMEDTIVREVRTNGPTVAVITDGHPMFFDEINWNLLKKGKRRGMNVVALPAVSSLDTMMIDVGMDVGDGAQIVHANQLLLYDLTLDPHLQTYVLQIGKFGTSFYSAGTKRNLPGRFTPLVKHLTRFYPADVMVTLIISLGEDSIRRRVRLRDLDSARVFLHDRQNDGLTMHIPPCSEEMNAKFSAQLDDPKHLAKIAVLK